jgi:hypothetical protein
LLIENATPCGSASTAVAVKRFLGLFPLPTHADADAASG